MIGVDPHKGSHTAAGIDEAETVLGVIGVRCGANQLDRLLAWAARWPTRTWAVEGAGGLGYLLAQQLVAAGERVVDVPAQAGRSRPAAGHRSDQQERSQRRPLGGRRRHALPGGSGGGGRGPRRGDEGLGQAAS
jgi:transposase